MPWRLRLRRYLPKSAGRFNVFNMENRDRRLAGAAGVLSSGKEGLMAH